MKILFLLLVISFVGCSDSQIASVNSQSNNLKNQPNEEQKRLDLEKKIEAEQKERDDLFANLQKYVDVRYPNWKVKGTQRLSSIILSDDNAETSLYTVLITDGNRNKVIRILKQEFIMQDGTKHSEFNEPSNEVLKSFFADEDDQKKE